MKITTLTGSLGLAMLLGACAASNGAPSPASVSGSMAYPAPTSTGSLTSRPDPVTPAQQSGSMAYPAPRNTGSITSRPDPVTPEQQSGSMAYPAPRNTGVYP